MMPLMTVRPNFSAGLVFSTIVIRLDAVLLFGLARIAGVFPWLLSEAQLLLSTSRCHRHGVRVASTTADDDTRNNACSLDFSMWS